MFGMPVVRRMVAGFALLIAMVACGPAPAPVNDVPPGAINQTLSTVAESSTADMTGEVVWGRVPYCDCFALSASATDNVAAALEKAKLTVSLKELNPSDGWLYFVATYDPSSTTLEQVTTAMKTGGAEVLDGPP